VSPQENKSIVQEFYDQWNSGAINLLVHPDAYARGKTSGVEVDMRHWHVWTLRDGKAVRWRVLSTRAEALEAVGMSE
jgi:hypothetical protein